MSDLYEAYKATGNEGFGALIGEIAPYFSTIEPTFHVLKPGYAEVSIQNRKEVHNHLGTVHAIAMCNMAELVGGTMIDVSLPEGRRWIPKGMTVEYVAKAKTDLRAVANGEGINWEEVGDIEIPVEVFDTDDKLVFTARITMDVKMQVTEAS